MTTTSLVTDERVTKALQMIQPIQSWPHWNEIALCAQKEYGLAPEQFQERLPEYQRFLALCSAYPGIGMTSEAVDQLWHSHILHTSQGGIVSLPLYPTLHYMLLKRLRRTVQCSCLFERGAGNTSAFWKQERSKRCSQAQVLLS
jgi:hypothetical protein